jgi:hypothetical protein
MKIREQPSKHKWLSKKRIFEQGMKQKSFRKSFNLRITHNFAGFQAAQIDTRLVPVFGQGGTQLICSCTTEGFSSYVQKEVTVMKMG